MDWLELGYVGLFFATFLAATIIPFSSEAVLAAMLYGGFDPAACLIVASAGNWLGGLVSYGMGWVGNWLIITKWLRTSESSILKWNKSIKKYGGWMAFFCWLPFVGDVIALALGVFRTSMPLTFTLMLIGKVLRYSVLILVLL